MKTYTNKLWRITDLVRLIGAWKSEFEKASDIEKLNDNINIQNLIYLLFNTSNDCGLLIQKRDSRLSIRICVHLEDFIVINFEIFGKYKKRPCYENMLIIDDNETHLKIQYLIAEFILKDDKISDFFR